jgi:LPS-assembly lipoprotein
MTHTIHFLKKYFVLSVTLLLLAGCGFHLRGVLKLPPELDSTYIQSDAPNSEFTQILQRLLIANHINVVNTPKEATAILTLSDVSSSNALTSISGGAQAGQYTLYGSVQFSVIDAKTKRVLIKPTLVENTTTFNSNATQALSTQTKINDLMSVLQNEMAQNIVNQLTKIPNHLDNSRS